MISQQTEAKFRVSCLVIVFIGFLIAEASIAQDISQEANMIDNGEEPKLSAAKPQAPDDS